MTVPSANLLNAIVLIACSLWAFVAIGFASFTALIPGAFGLALMGCQRGVAVENKVIGHIAVALTLLVLIVLAMPLKSALSKSDTLPILRIALMIATSILAMVYFVKSFIDARRQR